MLSALEADRARVAVIEAQILEPLKRSLSALRAEKTLVQERLDSYKYPVLTLPNEIVSEIFIHYLPPYPVCPPLTGLSSPTLLTGICREWRQIALDTPELWRAIPLLFHRRLKDYYSERQACIDMWLRRSRSCPLSFEVESDDAVCVPGILAIVTNHCARLEYLNLHLYQSYITTIEVPMPLLRHLELRLDGSPSVDLLVCREAPLLRTVILNDVATLHVTLPWAQLTAVTLEPVYSSECVPILQQTSNLTHCELGLVCDDNGLPPKVQLPRLESLILRELGDEAIEGYLETLVVPALRSLHVPENFLGPNPIDALASFITKSGCKLQDVDITGPISVIRDLRQYRFAFPSISKLSLHGYAYGADHDEKVFEVDELES